MAFQSPSPGGSAGPGGRPAPSGQAAGGAPSPAALGEGQAPPHVSLGCGSPPRTGLRLDGRAWVSWQCLRAEGDGGGGSHCGKAWEALMEAAAKPYGSSDSVLDTR